MMNHRCHRLLHTPANAREFYRRCRHVSSLLLSSPVVTAPHGSLTSRKEPLAARRMRLPFFFLDEPEQWFHQAWFHTTPTRHLAVKRRRKRDPAGILERSNAATFDNDDKEDDAAEQMEKYKMTTQEFRQHSSLLISKIHAALVPLGPINPDMLLSRGRNELEDNLHHDNDTQEPVNSKNKNEQEEQEQEQPAANPSVGDYLWIDLGPVHGQYTIQADEILQIVILLSPISGQRVYRYNNKHQQQLFTTKADDPNRWMCTDDGHVLEGLLVRDLIRQIQGVPNL